jgi:hypothetical protein
MATLPLRALWIGEKAVEFSEGSMLDTNLMAMTLVSVDVRLPLGVNETVSLRAEAAGGRVYTGEMTTKMPRDMGGRNQPTLHIYEFVGTTPLEPFAG